MATGARILVDLERLKYPYSGLGQFSLSLGRHLLKDRPDAWSYSFLVPPEHGGQLGDGFEVLVPTPLRRFFPGSSPRFDLWHTTHQGSRYRPPRGTRYLVTIHDLNFLEEKTPSKSQRRLSALQKKLDGAAAVTFISESTRQVVSNHMSLPEGPARVIYNGFDPANFEKMTRPDFAPRGDFLFAIGIVSRKKNFHVLVEFVKRLENMSLVIAGTWADEAYVSAIKALAVEHGVSERVILPGGIEDGERNWLYQNCSAVLVPSLLEGFGFPLVEAMHFGKPVFSSVHGSLREIGGEDVFYFPSFDPSAMENVYRSSMELAGADEGLESRLKDRARDFSWRRAVEQYTNLYKELLNESS